MDEIPLFFTTSPKNSGKSVVKADFSSLNHEYEVVIEIEKESIKSKIEYTIRVEYDKLSPSGNPIVCIHKLSKTFIDGIEPDTVASKISALAGSIFNPLYMELNLKDKANKIYDFDSITEKWKNIKKILQKNYSKQTLASYIKSINQDLNFPDIVFEKLRNDWFLSLYFVPLYIEYKDPPEKEQWKFASLLNGKGVKEYTVIQSVKNLKDSQNPVLIFVKDTDNPETFTGSYELDTTTKLIKNIHVVITEKEGYTLRADIQCIKTHKKEKPKPRIPQKRKDYNEEAEWQKYLRKKKGFWGRLFD